MVLTTSIKQQQPSETCLQSFHFLILALTDSLKNPLLLKKLHLPCFLVVVCALFCKVRKEKGSSSIVPDEGCFSGAGLSVSQPNETETAGKSGLHVH